MFDNESSESWEPLYNKFFVPTKHKSPLSYLWITRICYKENKEKIRHQTEITKKVNDLEILESKHERRNKFENCRKFFFDYFT